MTREPMETVRGRFRIVFALCVLYFAATVATIGFLVWARDDRALVTTEAWVHGVILLLSAGVLLWMTRQAAAGSAQAYLRLRIIATLLAVASFAEAAIPGLFPGWMRIEQAGYGAWLLLILAVSLAPRVRAALST